jgi:hypothetical protein
VLKSGWAIEKLQEREMEKTKTLILMYSIIAVFIMNLAYIDSAGKSRTADDIV